MSTKEKLSAGIQAAATEATASVGLKLLGAQFQVWADAVRTLESQLEQALLDRDTLKAETLRLAKERDQWKVRAECLADPNRDVCEHGADQWTYCVPCEAPYVDEACIRLTTERDTAIKHRDEALYEARYMREQMAQSEAIYPERWHASAERAMLISERDSYAAETRQARRVALEWAEGQLVPRATDPTDSDTLVRARWVIADELARLDAEGDE